jgi:hypothetical protein
LDIDAGLAWLADVTDLMLSTPSSRVLFWSHSMVAARENGSPTVKLYSIFVSVVEGNIADCEALCKECVQLILHKWQLLPRVHSGGGGANAHKPLLHLMHQVVELKESSELLGDVKRYMNPSTMLVSTVLYHIIASHIIA